MRNRQSFFVLGVLGALAVSVSAQTPEVDHAEVLRRGDLVQHVDGYRAGEDDLVAEAMRPPASDADKWFISVVTTRGCTSCEELKDDWNTSRHLQSLAVPDKPKKSWAHWNTYSANDKSQAWRFKDLEITGYPTILVQPPRSGKYGKPSTVVFQETGYDGDDKKLAQAMVRAIKAYVRKQREKTGTTEPEAAGTPEAYGANPPWNPDQDDSVLPPVDTTPADGRRPLRIPPIDTETDERELLNNVAQLLWRALLKLLLSTFALTGGVAGIVMLVIYIRKLRIEAGKTPLVSDEQLADLLDLLKKDATPTRSTKKTS